MATQPPVKLNILTPEARKELDKLGADIAKGKSTLALLEELGLGVGDLRARLEWADKRRSILLEKG